MKANLVVDDDTLEAAEKACILRALYLAQGNVSKAARIAGIGRATLYRKMKLHQLVPEELGRKAKKE